MDRRERIADPEESMRIAADGMQSRMWTSLPGIIQKFDSERMVADIQPAINGIRLAEDGTYREIKMPLLLDCPVQFPQGGGCILTFPVSPGDECLVSFGSRCIDAWWQLGGVQGQAELRMHDLSDGFCIPGVRSQPRKISVNMTGAQLRSDDGSVSVTLNPTTRAITMIAPGGLHVTGPITSDTEVMAAGVHLTTHRHGGVSAGGSQTGAPS